jgi:hypothetical protein
MSIGLCGHCTDGVVLMADRQITKEGGLKYYEKKSWHFDADGFHFRIAGIYVGSPDLAGSFKFELKRSLSKEKSNHKSLDVVDIKSLIETALARVYKKYRRDWDLQMLVGLRRGQLHDAEYAVWRSAGKMLVDSDLDCIGVGDSSVIRYLFDTFGQYGHLTITEFFPLALYAMMQAKKYIEGCGGKTDCIVLRGNRDIVATSHASSRLYETEEELQFLEDEFVKLCSGYATSNMFPIVLSSFAERIGKRQPNANLMRIGYL